MHVIAQGYGIDELDAIATSAVRTAKNREHFLARVASETELCLRVIDGNEEGRLAFLSATFHFDPGQEPVAVVDIGGGSTEIVLGRGKVVERVVSIEAGAVRLTEEFLRHDPPTDTEYRRLRTRIRGLLDDRLPAKNLGIPAVIGSGGTLAALARVVMDLRKESFERVHGYEMRRADVKRALERLRSMKPAERAALPGLSKQRSDIIVAGVAILNEAMRRLRVNVVRVNDQGIREGLLLERMERVFARTTRTVTRERKIAEGIVRFARSCGYERAHSFHVAKLALRLFDDLADLHHLGEDDRRLLWCAAYLHDVGYHIDYSRHHRHGYHLVRHASLPGLTPVEVEILACVVRYHRRRMPRRRDPELEPLRGKDRKRVAKLTSLLRIADGLDRSHRGRVRHLQATVRGRRLVVLATVEGDARLETWKAWRKADLTRKLYGVRTEFVGFVVAEPASATQPPRHVSTASGRDS
jgi:exopolyphosphatase/guanosine-5'-triphosphate,3'-diphosphate pyrophosphatase